MSRLRSSFLALSALVVSRGQAQSTESWTLPRLETPPQIDGNLEESSWKTVPGLHTFRQVEPVPDGEPTERTEVFLAYDAQHLYFAVVAHDAAPDGIVATQRKRDADLSGDDHLVLVLDPFLDQRNGYYFAFNSLGARQDALIRGGITLNTDWDGLWNVVAQRTETGWTAEGSIPLSTLSFNARAPAWGLNVERHIARTGERMRWHGRQRQYEVNSLAAAGRLTGLSGLRRASGLELRPFTTLTYVHDEPTGIETTRLKPGIDVFYKLTESTTAVLTLNTDFADAEVDERQVNLTRFPVFFPEKRAFFLQDAGVFSYSLINNNPLPYHSRRIGIGPRAEVVDLVGGARISGREGRVNFGLLGVRTESSGPIEAKELAVMRVLLRVTDEVGVGTIGTWGDPRTNGEAWLAGFDVNYNTGRLFNQAASPFEGSLYFQTSESTGRNSDSDAYGWAAKYDSPTWGFTSYLDRVGADYYPALGNVRQTGVWTVTGKLDYEFNPEGFKRIVPAFSFAQRHSMIYDNREQETFGPEVVAESKRGDTLTLRAKIERERLPESFRVANGVVVLPGDFDGEHLEIALTLSKSRPVSANLSAAKRLYYGGDQLIYKSTLTWRPSPIFNLDAAFDYTAVDLPYARFPVRLLKLGGAIQFSPELVWSALGQYDNLSHAFGFNTRLRWTYAPGSDVFFVINQGANLIDDRWDFTRTEVSSKIGATWRF
ncbi:MAG TPA: DUF5916 domain-containing protein [Opitutaceae bacterium]